TSSGPGPRVGRGPYTAIGTAATRCRSSPEYLSALDVSAWDFTATSTPTISGNWKSACFSGISCDTYVVPSSPYWTTPALTRESLLISSVVDTPGCELSTSLRTLPNSTLTRECGRLPKGSWRTVGPTTWMNS